MPVSGIERQMRAFGRPRMISCMYRSGLVLVGATFLASWPSQGHAQQGILDQFRGLWAQIYPAGEPVQFNRGPGGTVTANLSFLPGLARIADSGGRYGSTIVVSGASFECYYLFLPIGTEGREFQWVYRNGDEKCPKTAYFKLVVTEAVKPQPPPAPPVVARPPDPPPSPVIRPHAPSYRVIDVAEDDVLNIRTAPNANARIVGRIPPHGTNVIVETKGKVWWRIQFGGVSGWVNSRYLALDRD